MKSGVFAIGSIPGSQLWGSPYAGMRTLFRGYPVNRFASSRGEESMVRALLHTGVCVVQTPLLFFVYLLCGYLFRKSRKNYLLCAGFISSFLTPSACERAF